MNCESYKKLERPFRLLRSKEFITFFKNCWMEVDHYESIRSDFLKDGFCTGPEMAVTIKGEPIIGYYGFWFIFTGNYEVINLPV